MAADQIKVVIASQNHRDGIIHLLKDSFLPRSPMWAALQIKWEEVEDRFENLIDSALADRVSVVAIDESTPDHKVIGCCLSKMEDLTDCADLEADFVKPSKSQKAQVIANVHNQLMRGWKRDLTQDGVKKAVQLAVLCVDDSYGGRGVAQKLVERSMALAAEIGADYAFSLAANWRSQRVFDKFQFETRRTLEYAKFLDPNTGKPYVVPQDGSATITWVVKKIAMDRF